MAGDSAFDVFVTEMWAALGGQSNPLDHISVSSVGSLPSVYAVTDLACAAIGCAGLAVAELSATARRTPARVDVDRRLASFWFRSSIRPIGWELAEPWDRIAGDYRTSDGWIRLHTNVPIHRAAAQRVIGAHTSKASVADEVKQWSGAELEVAIIAAGGCAAQMHSREQWSAHPQGQAVAAEPLVDCERRADAAAPWRRPFNARPLTGVRVLDLTRVLAGPVAGRFLAGLGAQVLRIDPPDWDEPAVVPEVTLGKRCARLDLRLPAGRQRLRTLLAETDILLHGYRPGALDGLGFGNQQRREIRPGLVDVCLDAYGWSGPWQSRRGFDSLVQMSCGIAEAGMRQSAGSRPVPLPVQALDHATGYLMAAAAIQGLACRTTEGRGFGARLSLARTAHLLTSAPAGGALASIEAETTADLAPEVEDTSWGPARRLLPPVSIGQTTLSWSRGASALGSSPPGWSSDAGIGVGPSRV